MRMSAEFYFFFILQDVLNMIRMVWYKQLIKQLRKLLLELIKNMQKIQVIQFLIQQNCKQTNFTGLIYFSAHNRSSFTQYVLL